MDLLIKKNKNYKRSVNFYFGPLPNYRSSLLFINKKRKNLFFTLTDLNGSVLCSVTAGKFDIKRRKRMSPQTVELLTKRISTYAKMFRISLVDIILKVKARFMITTLVRTLKFYGFKLLVASEIIPIAHNGCRKKKKRRL